MDFTGFTVVNAGALTNINAHRNHRAFFDNHAFYDFRTRADKAVIFDDGRVRLQRLQYATDADTAGQVNVLTDLRAGTDGCPVSTIVPSST